MDAVVRRSENSLQTEVLTVASNAVNTTTPQPVLRLRLQKPKNDKKVVWSTDTVDNEHMNKKKSKCCCIYKRPLMFGESSSEDDEDCENCCGHPEKRRRNRKPPIDGDDNPSNDDSDPDYHEAHHSNFHPTA